MAGDYQTSRDSLALLVYLPADFTIISAGIDSEGHAANFVETEQIVIYEGAKASFVQASMRVPQITMEKAKKKDCMNPRYLFFFHQLLLICYARFVFAFQTYNTLQKELGQ